MASAATTKTTAKVPREVWRARIPLTDEEIAAFCGKWGLSEFAVFGSLMWDEYEPTDEIEVAVTFRPGVSWPWTGLPQMEDELNESTGRCFSVGTRRGIEQAKPHWRDRILREIQTLYAN